MTEDEYYDELGPQGAWSSLFDDTQWCIFQCSEQDEFEFDMEWK